MSAHTWHTSVGLLQTRTSGSHLAGSSFSQRADGELEGASRHVLPAGTSRSPCERPSREARSARSRCDLPPPPSQPLLWLPTGCVTCAETSWRLILRRTESRRTLERADRQDGGTARCQGFASNIQRPEPSCARLLLKGQSLLLHLHVDLNPFNWLSTMQHKRLKAAWTFV